MPKIPIMPILEEALGIGKITSKEELLSILDNDEALEKAVAKIKEISKAQGEV